MNWMDEYKWDAKAIKERGIKCPVCSQNNFSVGPAVAPKDSTNYDNIVSTLCFGCGHIMTFNRKVLQDVQPKAISQPKVGLLGWLVGV
jgi:hypothetical protein